MLLGQLTAADLARRLAGDGLAWRTGPFNVRVRSPLPAVHEAIALQYGRHPLAGDDAFCDCTIEVAPPPGLRRWLRPQVRVRFDGRTLFEPLPVDQAYALLEWTLNWWVSSHAHHWLLLHAAVVERDGRAVVLPAEPGAGKSTLCAGLVQRGWRLMSDEMALISLDNGELHALARPISLKNASLDVIRAFAPGAVLGREARDTAKGTVAHLRPKPDDVDRAGVTARPRWVVFPRYAAGEPAALEPMAKADAMMEIGRHSFNYALLGGDGFDALAALVTASDCHRFRYSRLDDAIAVFDALARAP